MSCNYVLQGVTTGETKENIHKPLFHHKYEARTVKDFCKILISNLQLSPLFVNNSDATQNMLVQPLIPANTNTPLGQREFCAAHNVHEICVSCTCNCWGYLNYNA